ncbi:unnamed protein product [Notodromas monacha]|uniref:GAF domain-containing protein n=1 Tax=Notodromas monacha TaxID=399045 RepID=A0A7R9C293_9CRUS|nr:unnamed protein product [Notodromas monacha]CAG0925599.1 unnamed protein product [Notodromas monacha]
MHVCLPADLEDVLWPTQGKGSRVIPFGVGIAGHVAQTKESLNLRNAYQDSRFDQSIDQVTGYRTESLLCMPMCNYEGHVTGVAQIINKRNGETEFTARDEMVC